jgi:hypothetical protein
MSIIVITSHFLVDSRIHWLRPIGLGGHLWVSVNHPSPIHVQRLESVLIC